MRLRLIILTMMLALSSVAHAAPGDRIYWVSDPVFRAYTSRIRATSTVPRVEDNLPTQFDMVMLAGVDYSLELTHVDATGAVIDLTGSVFYSQFRSAPAPSGVVFANFSTPLVSAVSGTSRVTLSAAQTNQLSGRIGLWDLLHINAAGISRYRISGRARVQPVATVPQ